MCLGSTEGDALEDGIDDVVAFCPLDDVRHTCLEHINGFAEGKHDVGALHRGIGECLCHSPFEDGALEYDVEWQAQRVPRAVLDERTVAEFNLPCSAIVVCYGSAVFGIIGKGEDGNIGRDNARKGLADGAASSFWNKL